MTVRKADTMTSEAVPAIHAGANVCISSYAQDTTLTAAQTIALFVAPGGVRFSDCTVVFDGNEFGGSAVISIAVQGNTLLSSAAQAPVVRADDVGLGARLTSDATVTFSITNVSADSVSLGDFRVISTYLADKDPD